MATTRDTTPALTTAAVVTIRIPCGTGSDLVTEAESRLSRTDGVADVLIEELRRLDPKLSATNITIGVTIHWATKLSNGEVRARLADVSGLESVTLSDAQD